MNPPRFGMRVVLGCLTACCGIAAAMHWFGVVPIAAGLFGGIVLVLLFAVWCGVYTRAPRLTRHATALVAIGGISLFLFAHRVLKGREEATRNRYNNNLRGIVEAYGVREQFVPRRLGWK
jgi:hypothetical protein